MTDYTHRWQPAQARVPGSPSVHVQRAGPASSTFQPGTSCWLPFFGRVWWFALISFRKLGQFCDQVLPPACFFHLRRASLSERMKSMRGLSHKLVSAAARSSMPANRAPQTQLGLKRPQRANRLTRCLSFDTIPCWPRQTYLATWKPNQFNK